MKSCHIFAENILKEVGQIKKLAAKYGMDQVVLNCPTKVKREVYESFAKTCNQTQMTDNERNSLFDHISSDNEKVVYLSYSKEGLDAAEHLPKMNVELWMMDADGGNKEKILEFFGGQGSINVNSWSPDSKKIAFVTYELEHKIQAPCNTIVKNM